MKLPIITAAFAVVLSLLGLQPSTHPTLPVDQPTLSHTLHNTHSQTAAAGAATSATVSSQVTASTPPAPTISQPTPTPMAIPTSTSQYFTAYTPNTLTTDLLSTRLNSLITIVGNLASLIPNITTSQQSPQPLQQSQFVPVINQQIAGNGNPTAPFAASNAINQLSSTNISNPTFTGVVSGLGASAIPDLSAKYALVGSGSSNTLGPTTLSLLTVTGTTTTSTFAGPLTGNWTTVDYDNFARANGLLNNSTTPSGNTWTVTGPNAASLQILNGAAALTMPSGTQTAGENAYMYLTQSTRPTRVGGRFKVYTTTALMTVSWNGQTSAGQGIDINHIIHVNIYAAGNYEVSYYVPGASHTIVNCASSKEAHDTSVPLTLGQEYSMYASLAGDHLHLDLPQGGSADCYDPHFSQAIPSGQAGSVYWQIMDSSANPGTVGSWTYVETDGASPSLAYPTITSSGGFQGPLGNVTPGAVFATGLTIGTGTTTNGQLLVNSTSVYNPQAGIVVKNSTIAPQISLVATGTAVTTGTMGITFDQQTPGESPSSIGVDGSSQNLKFTVGGEDRIAMQYFNPGVGIGTSTPWARLSIKEKTGSDASPLFAASDSNDSNKFLITGSGFVGINNVSPAYSLDVKGFINTDGVVGGYKLDGNTVLQASSTRVSMAVGQQALNSAYTGTNNIAVGYQSLLADTSGANNVALGVTALANNTTGTSNLGIGTSALNSNVSGADNVGIGANALSSQTGSTYVGIGSGAGQYGQGASSVFIGFEAGKGTGAYSSTGNTYVGFWAGHITTGNSLYNTCIGYITCSGLTNGISNVIIGAGVDAPISSYSAGGNAQLNIGNVLYGTNLYNYYNTFALSAAPVLNGSLGVGTSTPWAKFAISLNNGDTLSNAFIVSSSTASATSTFLVVKSTGNVGVGTTTPYSRLTVWGPDSGATTSAFQVVNNASTTVFAVYDNGNSTYSGSIFQSSDQRLKTNVQSLDASSSLSLINQLNPVTYNWIDPNKGTGHQYGFIAQQVLPIFPDLIATTSATNLTPDGTLTFNYIGLVSPIVKAIQALSQGIASLQGVVAGFAQSFTTRQLCLADSNGTSCYTRSQIDRFLAGTNQNQTASASTSTSSTASNNSPSAAPVLQLNGNASSTITAGSVYLDLGAIIAAPAADTNLGIVTVLDGATTTSIFIDTRKAGVHTILYTVTDPKGLTGSVTRTVTVAGGISTPAAVTTIGTTTSTTTTMATSSAS